MSFQDQLQTDGYTIVEGVLSDDEIEQCIELLTEDAIAGGRGGRRNLLAIPEMRTLANTAALMELVRSVLGEESFPVRGILFDKQDGANWKVPWHQDLTIAVRNRQEMPGFGPWSLKEGVDHVQPPGGILDRMVSVRLHIDDCPASNGALRVIAGSHLHGRLDQNSISDFVDARREVVCEVKKGGILLMKPLTIHASSEAQHPLHRRVIHFDYANVRLPQGLEWYERE